MIYRADYCAPYACVLRCRGEDVRVEVSAVKRGGGKPAKAASRRSSGARQPSIADMFSRG